MISKELVVNLNLKSWNSAFAGELPWSLDDPDLEELLSEIQGRAPETFSNEDNSNEANHKGCRHTHNQGECYPSVWTHASALKCAEENCRMGMYRMTLQHQINHHSRSTTARSACRNAASPRADVHSPCANNTSNSSGEWSLNATCTNLIVPSSDGTANFITYFKSC